MKNFYLIFLISYLIAGLYSCKKDYNEPIQNQIDEELIRSERVIRLINLFENELMNSLRTEETISLDSAIWYTEATLNYNYADPEDAEGEYSLTTHSYTLSVEDDGEVLLSNVQTFYEQMEDDLGNNQKSSSEEVLVFSDVALDSLANGTAYMTGTNGSSSGSSGSSSPFDEDDDWIWGTVNEGIYPPEGKCDGTMVGDSDGSNELEWHLNNPVPTQEPPFYTDIEIVEVTYWTCWYNEPPQLPRVFSTDDEDHCMEDEELTFFYNAALWIIDDYNDVSNDQGSTVYIEDGEGARPEGKDSITIEIEDDFSYIDTKYFHRYYISYGIPTVLPSD